jgi:hypothetical protein
MQGQLHGCRRVGWRGQGRDAMPQRDDNDGVGMRRALSLSDRRKESERGGGSELGWRREKRPGGKKSPRDTKTEKRGMGHA